MTNIIDYGKLTKAVVGYKSYVEKFNLDLDEEKLILDIAQDARINKITALKMTNATNNIPLDGLFKRIMGKMEEKDE